MASWLFRAASILASSMEPSLLSSVEDRGDRGERHPDRGAGRKVGAWPQESHVERGAVFEPGSHELVVAVKLRIDDAAGPITGLERHRLRAHHDPVSYTH